MQNMKHLLAKIRNSNHREIGMNTTPHIETRSVTRKHFTHAERIKMLEMAYRGYRMAEIARDTGRSDTGVTRLLSRYGIVANPERRDYAAIEVAIHRLVGEEAERGEAEAPPENLRERTCIDCADEYVMEQGEYDWFETHPGLELPRRCPACRKAKRMAKEFVRQTLPGGMETLSELSDKLLGAYAAKVQVMEQEVADDQSRIKGYADKVDGLIGMADELRDRTAHLATFALQVRESLRDLQDMIVADYDETLPDEQGYVQGYGEYAGVEE